MPTPPARSRQGRTQGIRSREDAAAACARIGQAPAAFDSTRLRRSSSRSSSSAQEVVDERGPSSCDRSSRPLRSITVRSGEVQRNAVACDDVTVLERPDAMRHRRREARSDRSSGRDDVDEIIVGQSVQPSSHAAPSRATAATSSPAASSDRPDRLTPMSRGASDHATTPRRTAAHALRTRLVGGHCWRLRPPLARHASSREQAVVSLGPLRSRVASSCGPSRSSPQRLRTERSHGRAKVLKRWVAVRGRAGRGERPSGGQVRPSGEGRGCRARRAACGSTGVGALVIGSMPDWVFGKAMTSRMFSSPARIATRRSMPKAEAAVRRGAVLERVEEEAEPLLRLLVADAEEAEDARLQLGLVDPDGTRTRAPSR